MFVTAANNNNKKTENRNDGSMKENVNSVLTKVSDEKKSFGGLLERERGGEISGQNFFNSRFNTNYLKQFFSRVKKLLS